MFFKYLSTLAEQIGVNIILRDNEKLQIVRNADL